MSLTNDGGMYMPVAPAGYGNGFGGFGGVNAAITSLAQGQCAGFANVESSAASRSMANLQQQYAMQTAIDGRLDSLAMSLQNCCCENRAAVADLKYTIANEGSSTRAAIASNTQAILDKLCQQEIDALKTAKEPYNFYYV